MRNAILKTTFLILFLSTLLSCAKKDVLISIGSSKSDRIQYSAKILQKTLISEGYNANITSDTAKLDSEISIIISTSGSKIPDTTSNKTDRLVAKESFQIKAGKSSIKITGNGESGALYGCFELSDRIKENGDIPFNFSFSDKPEMVLRGACIGMQKTEYLPGRDVYEYPYTPENFPWFYDKDLWIKYLDMLASNRMNSFYLWNGHPFASLVKLEDYPYALEVDDETFKLNEEMFSFITKEADKRGIWVIQMFYNIIVSKPFAEHHNIKTQERSRSILPVTEDYTRKSVAAFIEKYPNVGLMVCLGEAMNTIEDDIDWFTNTILPGVKDGLNALDKTEEPPVILRGHDTDAKRVMDAALPIYKNLYTTHKYNGESLTTYEPRGSWAEIHQGLSSLGSIHISNVHILANLEPFRYGSPNFIQKSVVAMHDIQGANGLHLYPQSSYWDWPYTADNTTPRTLQIDRDWMWYKTWGRYAWNCRRDRKQEIDYWSNQISEYYGCSKNGKDILKAYEESGEIAPKLLRRFGITDGNRQTLLLGMFMSQLINPEKWRVYSNFYTSNGPEGEILIDYAKKEWEGTAHKGETPPQIINEVVEHGRLASEAIDKASPSVSKNIYEFERLKNDVHCYNAFANFFAEKVNAALFTLRYKYSNNIEDLEAALPHLQKSIDYYKELVERTKDTYLYANSMQTQQRRIPIDGTDGNYKTWIELLPNYVSELENFKNNIEKLKLTDGEVKVTEREKLRPAEITLLTNNFSWYSLNNNQRIYSDKDYILNEVAPELSELKGLKLNFEKQKNEGTVLKFKNATPVKVVVGYFNGHSFKILPAPTLETDASANNRGQADIKIANALKIDGLYPVNIYTYYFEAGENELILNKGIALILGFMEGNQQVLMYDAEIGIDENNKSVDWLFY